MRMPGGAANIINFWKSAINIFGVSISAVAACLVFACTPITALAQANLSDLIIRDVHIIKSGTQTENTLANVQIVDNKIELISADAIPAEENMKVLDARQGYLLGDLVIGSPPNFIILSADPQADINILMDTQSYLVFAVDDGQIVANRLRRVLSDPEYLDAPADRPRVFGYSAPPIALPTAIESGKKWNAWQTKYVNGIFISALALDRQWLRQDDNSISQFGDLSEDYERGTVRGWRFGVAGTLNFAKPWFYNVAWAWNPFDRGFETETNELQFFDFSVAIPISKDVSVTVGKQKEPINMDRSMTMIDLASQERYSAADAMFPSRNVGVVVNGTAANRHVSWAGGVFNDWLVENESLSESATQAVGRVTWLPFLSEDESRIFHVGLGVRHTDAKQGLAYGSRPETGDAPRFVDTGDQFVGEPFAAESSTLYNWEAGWRGGPYWVIAEYSDNHVDAPSVGNPNFTGYHLSGTWSLSGEMRPYKKSNGTFRGLPVSQNVNQGGWGAWELGLRFSSIDLTEGTIEGGEMDIATFQVNWWATKSFAVSLNYRRTWTDRFGVEGQMDAFVSRVMLILQ